MADIELVIKMPEEVRVTITRMGLLRIPDEMQKKVDRAIQNGIPLPKGHGRLIDADAYAKRFNTNINGRIGEEYIFAPTIVEADTLKRRKGTPLEENDNDYNCENWIP